MARIARLVLALVLALAAAAGPALAVKPDEILPDKTLEARARSISAELRCMVCQNQSIDDSDAPLARDLRLIVRERLKLGDTDEGVKDFLVERYGQFVLLRPRFSGATALLWIAPFLILALAGGGIAIWLRRRAAEPAPAEATLSDDEKRRLEAILARDA
jgi:cytochrome c-type biogenesis protein CcmH